MQRYHNLPDTLQPLHFSGGSFWTCTITGMRLDFRQSQTAQQPILLDSVSPMVVWLSDQKARGFYAIE
jgi:hypothetical protein